MLHILLLLLKIAGIIILSVLGLVLLAVLLVLFVPVSYTAIVKYYDNKPHVRLKAVWLAGVFRALLEYTKEGKLNTSVKVFMFRIYPAKKNSNERNYSQNGENNNNIFDEIEENDTKKDTVSDTQSGQGCKEKINDISDNMRLQSVKEYDITASKENLSYQKKKGKKTKKRKGFFDLIHEKIKAASDNIKKIYKKIKNTKQKAQYISEKINNPENRAFIKFIYEQFKLLMKKIKPKKFKGYVHFGFEDPSLTGKVTGYAAFLYMFIGNGLDICPDFTRQIFEGEVYIKGYVRIFDLCVIALRVYRNKGFRKI